MVSAAESEKQDVEKIHLKVLAFYLTNSGHYDSINSLFRNGILKDEKDYSPKIFRSLVSNCMDAANKVIKLSLRGNLNEK